MYWCAETMQTTAGLARPLAPQEGYHSHLHCGFQLHVHSSRMLISWQESDDHQRSAKCGIQGLDYKLFS